MGLRKWLDRYEPLFLKGGKYERFGAIWEMVDTILYTPSTVTRLAPHARASIDLKRAMTYVFLATFPCVLFGLYNTGYQANLALAELGQTTIGGWRGWILDTFAIGYNAQNPLACVIHGLLYFLPIYVVTLAAGGICEVAIAMIRGHEVNEGFFVTSILYVLIVPATTPLWQVALGIIFGVIIGKEIFGGTGKNILNPALTGRAFLYFAYPAQMSGNEVWVPVDGYTGATALSVSADQGHGALSTIDLSWWDAFFGFMQGSLGETSVLACLIGGVFLVYTRIVNWRLIVGCLLGTIVMSTVFNLIGSDTNPLFAMPWYWHIVLGGYAFGLVYMVTEPVTASMTNVGRLWYAVLIGAMCVLIRVVNPAFPEGMMLAILFGNVFSPLIDYFVVQANIRRRRSRHA